MPVIASPSGPMLRHARGCLGAILALAVAVALSSCASSSRKSIDLSSASCLTKQNYCLDGCKDSFDNVQLTRALAGVLIKPKTAQERSNLAKHNAEQEQTERAQLSQCRSNCDKAADQCRSR